MFFGLLGPSVTEAFEIFTPWQLLSILIDGAMATSSILSDITNEYIPIRQGRLRRWLHSKKRKPCDRE